jgi:hypothetical protein
MTIRVLLLLSLSLIGCKTAEPPDSQHLPCAQRGAQSSEEHEDTGLPKPALVRGPGFVGVIFPANTKEIPGLYPAGVSYWTPSESDILAAEEGLIPFLGKSVDPKAPEILKRIGAYRRQYRGIVLGGHKQIFIRFFCETLSDDWTSHEMVVLDGGSCFFNLRFSTETKAFSHLWVNGEA